MESTFDPEAEIATAGCDVDLEWVDATAYLGTENGMATEVAAMETTPAAAAPKLAVQGRYRGGGARQLELRVDVDGVRPTKRVSGDVFQTSGATTSYVGSFIVNTPTVSITPTTVRVEGTGVFTWPTTARFVRVSIPRASAGLPRQPATVRFFTSANAPAASASYLCAFVSQFFRSIQWEQDSVAGVVPFVSYNTGLLPRPPGSPARVLSVPAAYAEAGIDLQISGTSNVIPAQLPGDSWSNSELHNAMVNHFSLHANRPQWRTWLLVATAHDGGYRGIMFDATGPFQRQGCAVFYDAIRGTDPDSQRAQLRTYVHELGHAFNLLHSWQKDRANPPQPLGPNNGLGDRSWMNYVQDYQAAPGTPIGAAAYWADFPFEFTTNELIHLRHGFHRDVVMGGNPFFQGAADIDPDLFDAPIVDNSGLALELRVEDGLGRPRSFAYGEPVVAEIKLSRVDLRGRDTHGYLHPNDNRLDIMIRKPSGQVVIYRPLLHRCADESRTIRLDDNRPAIYESAFIGYGKDGFYFDQPGQYALRAQYVADDGSRVVSPVLRFRVRFPLTESDTEVGELLMDDAQGQLLYLLGSDAKSVQSGNDALDLLLDKYGSHPLAVYACMLKGINAERDYKNLTAEKEFQVRSAKPEESIALLTAVEEASAKDKGVDNVTLNMVMHRHADAEAKAGRPEQATRTMDRMVQLFAAKGLNPHVMATIGQQAKDKKDELAAEAN